jgi:hypothetical protein
MKTHLDHKFQSVRQNWLAVENLHADVRESYMILLEKETEKKF